MIGLIRYLNDKYIGFSLSKEPRNTEVFDNLKEKGILPDDPASQLRRNAKRFQNEPKSLKSRSISMQSPQKKLIIGRLFHAFFPISPRKRSVSDLAKLNFAHSLQIQSHIEQNRFRKAYSK